MKILLVENEHKIARAIKQGLEQEAYVVDLAFDGEAGFDLASTEEYDLIILDLMLPKMDGLAVCQKLRQEESVHTPILMLTAKGELDDKVQGFNLGADDYLVKPFAFVELLARVRALGRRPRSVLPTLLKAGDLSLDTVSFEVKRQQKPIALSKKEFTLLEYLMRNAGKIINKDQIMSHVWNWEANVLPNTIEVYIGYLRRKIDKPFSALPALIKTIRGFGYKLESGQVKNK
ncbi:response regulator transcription factor [Patescibacteria group bacterium]|nr:response regulator transcription factor [Patescibacteria group bacterium]